MVKNTAFVFIKPHAVTDKVKELVKSTLEKKELTIKEEGSIEAEKIDKDMLIDKHYYAIAAKATLKKPSELNIPKEKFKEFFGVEWADALKDEKVFNAKDACEKLGVDSAKLDELWAAAKKAGKLVKFGGGFYCGEVSGLYVFNGFFMSMRAKFVDPGTSIYYYVVTWDSKALPWADFRSKVLGPTDPADAPADSLRGTIAKQWKELGLKAECNTGDNAVHASASPFEALAERVNWLSLRPQQDPFGKLLLKAGVTRTLIKDWSLDPQVTYGVLPIKKSLFDSLEDTDSDYCLALCQMIASFARAQAKPGGPEKELQKEVAQLKEQLALYEAIGKAVASIQAFVPPSKVAVAQPKAKAKSKAKAKAKVEENTEKAPKKPKTPEKEAVSAKINEIRGKQKELKKEGKTKEEIDVAVASLVKELQELKAVAAAAKPAETAPAASAEAA
mmetsp:Transcript_60792/g.131884  ORF Transcript_60792/g.131884 Transcript_60792/m.131884 type:complete len:446 (-) Transcript_60792:168-1505(-)|eukprot:CAMPEP_0170608892 /NCGR_PEP_ID=MMETSP0224-20130122/21829_1 /TAXON_ID=285029 /ORGANISM="Togula jolla, Strain CCCM 725" /LENGTH=445 /DNA_ID=CAMNT_0010934153 /DNA_START=87 /DNA_END=1424 /DNA_ORIENTATION=-